MDADAQVAPVAALVADSTRSTILFALSDGRMLPACELALQAGVKAPTISYHLDKLIAGGLVAADRRGRHRYYRLASPSVVGVLEALATLAPSVPARTFREGQTAKALRFARTCYDHLAGFLGVQIADSLVRQGCLVPGGVDYELTPDGARLLTDLGVDVAAAAAERRRFARTCLDWSERRDHLAGSLGAALLVRLFELQWIERTAASRAVRLTELGRRGLCERFHLEIVQGGSPHE
ncbi:MAG TPA: winged helix-turn-helix domain-containing protein [Thermoanaerobaculia bacterium]|nr:winged helix-turn-helix domain-containing protein [Thermoanaerobaculia bacterium]